MRAEPSEPQGGGSGERQLLRVCVWQFLETAPHPEVEAGLSPGGAWVLCRAVLASWASSAPSAREHVGVQCCVTLFISFALFSPRKRSYSWGGWRVREEGQVGKGRHVAGWRNGEPTNTKSPE